MQALIIIISTIILFVLMQKLYAKMNNPLFLPILTVTIITSVVLVIFNIPYDTYMKGGEWIQRMLGPAVVALAYPLYNQMELIFKYKFSILVSLIVAMVAGLVSVYALLKLFSATDSFIYTALPKSLTTPVAMQVSDSVGGIAPLTAVLVMVAGFTGAIFGPLMYKWVRIDTPISRGVAMGSASHGVGITKLKEYGEEDLSIGSLSMGLSAVLGAVFVPIFALLFM
ncbi:MAG: LrgB family protein [Lysinibacillus sp.]